MKKNHNLIYCIFFIASFLVPFIIAVGNIYMGSIPFWYDPARVLLLGLRLALLLQLPSLAAYVLFGCITAFIIWQIQKYKNYLNYVDKKLLLLISLFPITTLSIYLLSKNPVWEYHFIGVEILSLLFIDFLAKKNNIVSLWTHWACYCSYGSKNCKIFKKLDS